MIISLKDNGDFYQSIKSTKVNTVLDRKREREFDWAIIGNLEE